MFCFWTYLSLFFVLQHSVSSDEEVSLKCSRTVEVTSGDTETLNCDIIWMKNCENKNGNFYWYEANNSNNNLCDLEGNTCKSDDQTYGSLTISDIQKNKTISVVFTSGCGIDVSSIRVLVYDELKAPNPDQYRNLNDGKDEEEEKTSSSAVVTAGILAAVSAAIIVILVIYFVQFKIKPRTSLNRRSQQDSLDQL